MNLRLFLLIFLVPAFVSSQENTSALSNLTTPTSPAFIITDITPTLVQSPTTPKSFVLGIAQSLAESSAAFPDNYSAMITPYWWIKSEGRNVYSFLGLDQPGDFEKGQNPLSGLKFSTLSVAFINKDLIPDEATSSQKAFSIGGRSTILQVRAAENVKDLYAKLAEWHSATQAELSSNADVIARIARLDPDDADYKTKRIKILTDYQETITPTILKSLNELIAVKPIFSWDISAGMAMYGINDKEVKTGRTGVWSTVSTYIPLSGKNVKNHKNYFNLHASIRYLRDNYQKNDLGLIEKGSNFDYGGKAGFVLNQLSLGVESIYRSNNKIANPGNRTVGSISVKVANNIFVNGTFGKDFGGPNKLISVFGLNWGFGEEQVSLP